MNALILVAGQSLRMGEITRGTHKTLLPVGNRPILSWMLRALAANDITSVLFVCGFHQDMLRNYVRENHPEIETTWIENPDYADTNTAYSLWLARDAALEGGEGLLLINGDVVLDSRAVAATLAPKETNVLATRFDRVEAEEVKVRLDGSRRIVEIGKHLVPGDAAGESVGINRLSPELLPELFETLRRRIEEGEGRHEFYEQSFNELIEKGAPFHTADVTELPVMEVDTPDDYAAVKANIAHRLVE